MQEWERETWQPATLEDVILAVLEHHDGLCMDEVEERDQLARALHQALLAFLNQLDNANNRQRDDWSDETL